MEEKYLLKNAENILEFARELFIFGEITKEKLDEVYFYNFIKYGKK